MLKNDRTIKFVLVWIAVMLTVIAMKEILQVPVLMAQEGGGQLIKKPIEVVIKGPIDVNIVEWSGYPSQPIKVKIDDPWPARIEIKDEVRVRGELKMQN